MEFRLLGPVEVRSAGQVLRAGPPQQRIVLAALAFHAGQTVPTDTILDRVWGEARSEYRRTLHMLISRIRRVLESADGDGQSPARIVRRSGGYVLDVDLDLVDVHRFQRLVRLAAAADSDSAMRADMLGQALALWQGEPLAGLPGLWAERTRRAWHQQYLDAVVAWAQAELDAGRPAKAIGQLTVLVGEYPLAESVIGLLMRALSSAGRPADALHEYLDARRRLAEELGTDPSAQLQEIYHAILSGGPAASSARGVRPASITPAQLPPNLSVFTGRAGPLAALDGMLANAVPGTVICAVSGTAGVGKTALAVHWAHRVADRFPDGQLYVNLRGFDADGQALPPADALRALLEAFDMPTQHLPADLNVLAALYRSLIAGKHVLVVLDNARDAQQVRPLLPGTPTALVVVTSRDRLTSLIAAEGAFPLSLDLMSTAEATAMLAERLGPDRIAAEPSAAEQVITACARLPLALAIVAARARQTGFPLAALAAELRTASGALDALDTGDPVTDIRAVLSWSYRCLSDPAARLFRLLGLHAGSYVAVPAAASLAGVGCSALRPLLSELTKAHLVTEESPGRYTLHDLLRAYAAELAHSVEPESERQQAIHRTLDHYLHTAHAGARLLKPHRPPIALTGPQPGTVVQAIADHTAALEWLTMSRPALLAAVRQAADTGHDRHAWQLSWTLVDFLQRQGHWQDQSASQQIALRSASRLADPCGQAHAFHGLARAMLRLGAYTDAAGCLRQALTLCHTAQDVTGQAAAHRGLALVLGLQGDHSGALRHALQAMDLYEATGDRAGQAEALNSRGWCHAQLGDYDLAVTCCWHALGLFKQIGDQRDQAETWDTLGFAYHHLAEYEQAVTCYHHALALFRVAGDRYQEADTLTHLGDTHRSAQVFDAAHAAWRHAHDILLELHHPDAAELGARLAALPQPA
ncbi:SARP family transcriptional regulator [Rhizocola hellebori]|uniref:SARP family transcriptional regulator n=1 Tax=Rhizocola hellebori TaxID=1392758 RepID=A0A8J3VEN8_9ACTN|nr:BTAD domain-containing putative transcriptional regulator [Rhizocola hellebori]GIH03715.1 SARP family transcriptional regulator [Rhizocola hellebori]